MSEQYSGTKFGTIFLKRKTSFSISKSRKLIEWAKIFSKENLAPSYGKGSSGNLSFRAKKGFVITPAAEFFEKLKPKDLVEVENFNFEENTAFVNGSRFPSSETPMHFLIYAKRKDVNAVFHFHDGLLLKKAEKLGIVSTLKKEDYGSVSLAESAGKLVEKNDFLFLKGHGFVCAGKSMDGVGMLCFKWHEKALGF